MVARCCIIGNAVRHWAAYDDNEDCLMPLCGGEPPSAFWGRRMQAMAVRPVVFPLRRKMKRRRRRKFPLRHF